MEERRIDDGSAGRFALVEVAELDAVAVVECHCFAVVVVVMAAVAVAAAEVDLTVACSEVTGKDVGS